jgi:hypothetical protein
VSNDDYQDHSGNRYDDTAKILTGASGSELRQAGVDASWSMETQIQAVRAHRINQGLDPDWGGVDWRRVYVDSDYSAPAPSPPRRIKATDLLPPDPNRVPADMLGPSTKTLDHPLVQELEEATGCVWFHFGPAELVGRGTEVGTPHPLLRFPGSSDLVRVAAWQRINWYDELLAKLPCSTGDSIIVYGCFEIGQFKVEREPICLVLGIYNLKTNTMFNLTLNESSWKSESALAREVRSRAARAYVLAVANPHAAAAYICDWLDDPANANAIERTRATFADRFVARRAAHSDVEDPAFLPNSARARRSVTQILGKHFSVLANKNNVDLETATGALWFSFGPVKISETVERRIRVGEAPRRCAYTADFRERVIELALPGTETILGEALAAIDVAAGDRIHIGGALDFAEIAEAKTPTTAVVAVSNLTKNRFVVRYSRHAGRFNTSFARLSSTDLSGLMEAYQKAATDGKNSAALREWIDAPERASILAEMRAAVAPNVEKRRRAELMRWLPAAIGLGLAVWAVFALLA